MVTFEYKVKTRGGSGGPLQRLIRNADALIEREEEALAKAAETATKASRSTFASRRSGRPFVSPRRGRRTTQGKFESHITWIDLPGDRSFVIFDEEELETAAPYYLINEIGTGTKATRFRHRPNGELAAESVAFPSQKGRYIKAGLVWADGANAVRSSNSRRGQDQIRRAGEVSTRQVTSGRAGKGKRSSPVNPLRTPRVRISRDIEPKHYIREGARAGYGQYSKNIRSAARSTFRRKKR